MAYMTREQLYFTHYSWLATEAERPARPPEAPGQVLLDRKEGAHVLAFINSLARQSQWDPAQDPRDGKTRERIPASGHKVETMLRAMPRHLTDRQAVQDWLEATWLTF